VNQPREYTAEQVKALERSTWNEKKFTGELIRLAQRLGWMTIHIRPARTSTGWRTAVQGDGNGFPDIQAVRGPRIVVAELKLRATQAPTPEQQRWLERFRCVPRVEVYLWIPREWNYIEKCLE
jgi:hypothetical protein